MDARALIGVGPGASTAEIELAAQARLAQLSAEARAAPNDSVRVEIIQQMLDVKRACAELEADGTGIDAHGYDRGVATPFSPAAAIIGGSIVAVLVALAALYVYNAAPGLFCFEGHC